MTEAKFKRLVVAFTVGAVMLLVILISVMVYQLVEIGVHNKRRAEYDAKIEEYNQLIIEGEETKEIRSMRWWIIREARELGLEFEGDNPLN